MHIVGQYIIIIYTQDNSEAAFENGRKLNDWYTRSGVGT